MFRNISFIQWLQVILFLIRSRTFLQSLEDPSRLICRKTKQIKTKKTKNFSIFIIKLKDQHAYFENKQTQIYERI